MNQFLYRLDEILRKTGSNAGTQTSQPTSSILRIKCSAMMLRKMHEVLVTALRELKTLS